MTSFETPYVMSVLVVLAYSDYQSYLPLFGIHRIFHLSVYVMYYGKPSQNRSMHSISNRLSLAILTEDLKDSPKTKVITAGTYYSRALRL